jgi:hypothetical protein
VDETLAARIAAEAAYHHPSIKKSQERKRPISCASFFSLSLFPSFFTFFFQQASHTHIHRKRSTSHNNPARSSNISD